MASIDISKVTFSEGDKLVGAKNYFTWAFIIEQILRDRELWDLVDPKTSKNDRDAESSTTYENKRAKIIGLFSVTVEKSILPTIQRLCDDPAKLWATLKQRYQTTATQRKIDLKSEIMEMKMTEGNSVEEYLQQIENIRVDLGNIGEEFPTRS
ncbi:unnamed protein product [Calypogeia fissa]